MSSINQKAIREIKLKFADVIFESKSNPTENQDVYRYALLILNQILFELGEDGYNLDDFGDFSNSTLKKKYSFKRGFWTTPFSRLSCVME